MPQALDLTDHIDVAYTRTIQGALRAGATIRSWAQLTVQGAFMGPVSVEHDAVFMVQGSFNGEIKRNNGTIILYGQVQFNPDSPNGKLAIGVDSLVTTEHGAFRLMPDGELIEVRRIQPAVSFNIGTDRLCVYVEGEQRFQPIDGLNGSQT